jgi:hypothetical protein
MQRLAIWLTLFVGLINGWRTFALIDQWDVLLIYGVRYSQPGLLVMSVIWTTLFLALGVIGWRYPRAVWLPIPLAFLLYTLYNVWLPTPTLPFLYWHLFLLIFTGLTLRFGGWRKQHQREGETS